MTEPCKICGDPADYEFKKDEFWICDGCWTIIGEDFAEAHDLIDREQAVEIAMEARDGFGS